MSDTTRLDLDAIEAAARRLYAAPEDVLDLVARVRELEAEVERLRSAHDLIRDGSESAEGAVRALREVLATNARAEAAEATIQRVRDIRDDLASLPGSWVGPWVHSYNVLDALNEALDGGPDTEEADRG